MKFKHNAENQLPQKKNKQTNKNNKTKQNKKQKQTNKQKYI